MLIGERWGLGNEAEDVVVYGGGIVHGGFLFQRDWKRSVAAQDLTTSEEGDGTLCGPGAGGLPRSATNVLPAASFLVEVRHVRGWGRETRLAALHGRHIMP